MLRCFYSLFRSILLYSFPCFCNFPMYLLNKIVRLQQRAARYFSEYEFCNLKDAINQICERLFIEILNSSGHPLCFMFETRFPTSRNTCFLRPPLGRTTRFSNSFILFARFQFYLSCKFLCNDFTANFETIKSLFYSILLEKITVIN